MGKTNSVNEDREKILHFLLQHQQNNRIKKGAVTIAVARFGVSRATVKRIWSTAKACIENNETINVRSKKKGKPIDRSEKIEEIENVELNRRTTLRSLGEAIDIPTTSLWRLLKNGKIKRHSNAIKPLLTEENKLKRLKHCLSFVEDNGRFKNMFDYIHIDEKWFYITKVNQKFYLLPEEKEPCRQVNSKSNMVIVMFLAAVGRPRFDMHKNQYFNGKLGIWPFVVKEPAQRNSKNRPKGTLVTKTRELTKKVYKEMIMQNLLPAIKQ